MLRILTLWLLFCLPVSAATILVVGDSLSAGYGLAPKQGWVYLLGQNLGTKHKVVNASISGDTTQGGLARLPKALQTHKPQIVIIELGGNDALRGLPISQMQANLEKMVKQSTQSKAKVLLVGIDVPYNYGKSYRSQFQAVYQNIAKQYKLPFVPSLLAGFETDLKKFQRDGIHPSKEAQQLMLDNVLPKLKPLL